MRPPAAKDEWRWSTPRSGRRSITAGCPTGFITIAEIYAREQERIFRGPVWSYLGLDAEIPNPGDFRADLCRRDAGHLQPRRDGAVKAFVNRCAHRGALVRRELSGNAAEHICIYHQWCYGLDGALTAIPFRRGIRGKGGLDPTFDMGRHGLRPLRVGSINGAIFGTLAEDAEPLEDYLGPPILAQLRRLFDRPVRVLGYNRQRIRGNWKLYAENTRDNYHASLLHEFLVTFGLDRVDADRRGQDGRAAPPQHHLGRGRQRHRRVRPPGLCRRPGAQRLPVAEGAVARHLPP